MLTKGTLIKVYEFRYLKWYWELVNVMYGFLCYIYSIFQINTHTRNIKFLFFFRFEKCIKKYKSVKIRKTTSYSHKNFICLGLEYVFDIIVKEKKISISQNWCLNEENKNKNHIFVSFTTFCYGFFLRIASWRFYSLRRKKI